MARIIGLSRNGCQTRRQQPTPMIPLPRIALVGRPNVGKSTLFNRICGRRKAITDSRPGSTRDRNYAQASWQGAAFELIDTGGLLLGSDDPLLGPAPPSRPSARSTEADLVLLRRGRARGLLPDDAAIARAAAARRQARARGRQQGRGPRPTDLARVRAARLRAHAPASPPSTARAWATCSTRRSTACRASRRREEDDAARCASRSSGRPNVGKSSLLNRLLGRERAVVSPIPGTTRDAVDSLLEQRRQALPSRGHRRHPARAPAEGERRPRERGAGAALARARRRGDAGARRRVEGLREMDATIGGYVAGGGRGRRDRRQQVGPRARARPRSSARSSRRSATT